MSGSWTGSGGFGGFDPRSSGGKSGMGIFDMLDQLKEEFEKKVGAATSGTRMNKGDVRAAVLALLAEQPMHGYQIIQQIEERSNGAWKPSAGSVYPTLQLLADEGLIKAEESGGRKTYSLTEAGRAEAEEAGGRAPWESQGMKGGGGSKTALGKAGMELAQAAAQVGRSGSAEQVKQAVDVLEDARRKLYSILAQD
ncbi:PadR family transcriptional regulator [Microbacterium sp. 4R-513]|uniref:PadR family transcriptional regulator n=1 Tax=Microbacterium sp. 4R-513 TaxID=2567934 RepID=UPI0013E1AC2F|nr:PadR family transcriptional regulator [Microbacterium sp. 4R-513]QIG39896.1 PadR family transcriptional regulator [Microbacterium sp. 4R-513]